MAGNGSKLTDEREASDVGAPPLSDQFRQISVSRRIEIFNLANVSR